MDTAPKAAEYKCLRFRLVVGGGTFSVSRGVVKKKGRNKLYLCIRRRKKKTIPTEQYLCVRQRKKVIGCLVGLGNLPGTQLSGVTGRVGENNIYIRPSPGRGCGRLQPPLHW